MSSSVTDPNATAQTGASYKGKGKAPEPQDVNMEGNDHTEDDDDDEEDDDDDEEDEDEEEGEETFEEIDPSAILPPGSRRTRGNKVDYTSKEAIEKAGLTGNEGDDEDEDVTMKD